MTLQALKNNLKHSKEILKEIYNFSNQLMIIDQMEKKGSRIDIKEKKLIINTINSLMIQLKILNDSIPRLLEDVNYFNKKLPEQQNNQKKLQKKQKLVKLKYKPTQEKSEVSLIITEKDRERFLQNLSQSNLSIQKLKTKYGKSDQLETTPFGKPNVYAKISNRFFRNISMKLVQEKYFEKLNKDLRKMNSQFVVSTYVSMIFMTMLITFVLSTLLFLMLLFYKISIISPFLTRINTSISLRFLQVFWVIIVIPIVTGLLMYIAPGSEAKSVGSKINQELPFVAIHMSSIATSGVEPINIFRIILKNKEYKYTNREFKKLLNLVNFHGYDLVTALKKTAKSSSSDKLRELLNGLSTTITTGGDLHNYLDKHSEGLLLDYKLEREKYTKASETLMDIYISIVIAAPMILLILFIVMGSMGMCFGGITIEVMGMLIIMIIALLNILFLVLLHFKQPTF